MSVSVGKGVGGPTGVRGDTQNGGGKGVEPGGGGRGGVAYHVESKHTGRSSRFLQSECGVALRPALGVGAPVILPQRGYGRGDPKGGTLLPAMPAD